MRKGWASPPIISSISAEADSTGTGLSCSAPSLAPNLAALRVTCKLRNLLSRPEQIIARAMVCGVEGPAVVS